MPDKTEKRNSAVSVSNRPELKIDGLFPFGSGHHGKMIYPQIRYAFHEKASLPIHCHQQGILADASNQAGNFDVLVELAGLLDLGIGRRTGETGSFGFGQRRDGASYRVEVDPYVHFSTYEVSEAQYKYLKEWQMANMRAIQAGEMQKMAAPAKAGAVSEAEAILNLTEAIKGATAVLEKTQIEKLKAAASAIPKR
ncbi:MAG: hypothetical protein NT093_01525 [Candidatus Moranbacteria bacterium]|nr:hypothetical protein [Candidatus Moranbacteria bacterium]